MASNLDLPETHIVLTDPAQPGHTTPATAA